MSDDTSIRTLRLKVKREAYAWLKAAAIEANRRSHDSEGQRGVRGAAQAVQENQSSMAQELWIAALARVGTVQIGSAEA